MNYYNEIKQKLIDNEIYKKAKDYSKNKNDLETYYNVGKLLYEAGKKYGENIIKNYSKKLTSELGKGYNTTALKRMRKFYSLIQKGATLSHQLTWSHYCELLSMKNISHINYYINLIKINNLSIRKLREKIKSKEYERLPNKTKIKLINKKDTDITDLIKNPIIIKNNTNYEKITEKILHNLILENIEDFMKELGHGFSYIGSEYKIKIGTNYNYIDLLLFNYILNSFVVVELKVTEIKKEYIGQIETYMNYIDKNVKKDFHNKTIGIIIIKKDNKYIMEYCSDKRIYRTTYITN